MILFTLLPSSKQYFYKRFTFNCLYAFAGYEILPALQKSYLSITSLRFAAPALDNLCEELKLKQNILTDKNIKPLEIEKFITLNNIYYNYPNTSQPSIKDISIEISAYSTVGLIGVTEVENYYCRYYTWSP